MSGAKRLLGAAVACLVGLVLQAPGLAQQKSGTSDAVETAVEIRERQTNESLLAALIERRAEILRTAPTDESRRVLPMIDNRIAEVRRQLER